MMASLLAPLGPRFSTSLLHVNDWSQLHMAASQIHKATTCPLSQHPQPTTFEMLQMNLQAHHAANAPQQQHRRMQPQYYLHHKAVWHFISCNRVCRIVSKLHIRSIHRRARHSPMTHPQTTKGKPIRDFDILNFHTHKKMHTAIQPKFTPVPQRHENNGRHTIYLNHLSIPIRLESSQK
ncbi:hypothetical protein HPP92_026105 [Vanilla planifolia]|uniref:Uncharacterized protein n=1 Tax=Vanilla planifolia TaxID=51239 RepID=A0A835PGW5_VANPL|nr:hypothetical protein HPP92_026105 [Vanilla planifolia]